MEAKASAKNMRGSAQKARLVVDLIRGKNVAHALNILQFTHKRAADIVSKCLKSAIANANFAAEKQNIAIDPDDLWVKSCFVDIGPTKRRFRMRPAPQGRAYRERRHYCHITVEVTSEKPPVEVEKDIKAKTAKENSAKRVADKKAAAPKKETKAAAKPKKAEASPVEEVETPVMEIAAEETAPVTEATEAPAKAQTEVKATEAEAIEAKAEMNAADQAEETIERKTESTTVENSETVKEPSSEQNAQGEGDKK
jgi:large subunit ribosomal protein L22